MHARGFPNCFIVSNTQSGFTVNFPHMLNEQSKHLAYIVEPLRWPRRSRTVEASRGGRGRPGSQTIIDARRHAPEVPRGVHARLLQQRGQAQAHGARNGSYGAGPVAFVKVLEDWRAAGAFEGLELTRA